MSFQLYIVDIIYVHVLHDCMFTVYGVAMQPAWRPLISLSDTTICILIIRMSLLFMVAIGMQPAR